MTTAHDHDGDLATLLRTHVKEQEPPFALSAETSMALGRRTLVRRRARRGLAGVLVAAAAVAAIPLLPWTGSGGPGDDARGIDPATAAFLASYDALKMPQVIEQHVAAAFGDSLDGLGDPVFIAGDEQGTSLPAEYYDKASSMEVRYGDQGDRQVRVALMHSAGEAEGDVRKNCANDLAEGYAFSCEVTTAPNGDVVTTRVMAMRKLDEQLPRGGWGAVTRDELRTGIPAKGDPSQKPIDPSEVFFMRSVESVHSDTFLTNASETVRAPDLAAAESLWKVPTSAMTSIVTDPELVIPKPPQGDNGCGWQLHPEGITCGVPDPS
ncbi:MAG TPA: hypothetical protein VFE07_04795 [Marmoricola sp.]|jgi:hypothetical protein|nr:hypothetical protein [Marmoricola sp.]